jgi:hypothetical protein
MAGARWCWIADPGAMMRGDHLRLTDEDIKLIEERVMAYKKLFDEASSFRVITHGETMVGELGGKRGRKCFALKCIAELPYSSSCIVGPHTGEAMNACIEGTADGVFVIDGAVGLVGPVKRPLKCTIKEGRLVKVEPENDEIAREFIKILEIGDDPNNRVLAEFSVGCNHLGEKTAEAHTHEIKKALGAIHIGFGENFYLGGRDETRGRNVATIHVDVVTLRPTLYLDETPVIKDGKLLY